MTPAAPSRLVRAASLDDLLLYRLARVLATASTPVVRLCEGRFGITRREWRMLALLAEHGALQPSQLAERARLDRARTSRALSSLVGKRLVDRAAASGDRRCAQVWLTEAGQALHAQLFPLVVQINRELAASLQAAEVELLEGALDRLERQAERLSHQAGQPKADRRRGGRVRSPIG